MKVRLALAFLMLVVIAAGVVFWRDREPPEEAYRRGLAALNRGDLAEVNRAIASLRDEPGLERHRHLLQAGVRLKTGDPRGALEELTFVPAAGELREPSYLLKGEALYKLGRLTESEQTFLRLDKLHPDHPQVCRWLAAIYYDLGAMHHAIERLEQLARLEPDDFSPHRLLAVIHSDFERYPQAIEEYREAIRRSPPESDRRTMTRDLARALIRERRYDEALASLKDAAPDAEVFAMRAESQWNLGDRDAAQRSWREAEKVGPDDRSVLLVGARMRLDTEKPGEAVPSLQRILQKDPHDTEARYQLAMAYRQLGRPEDAARELEQKEASQKLRDRLTQLNLQAMDEPRNAELRDELAQVCDQLGKPDLAAMWRNAAENCRRYDRLNP